MTVTQPERPDNVRLVPGAMQNWSDLDHHTASASAAVRALVSQALAGVRRVAIVGAAPLDLLTGLADEVPELTIVTRSIPDAATIGELLISAPGVQVVCGSATGVDETFEAVVVLADLSVVQSLEADPVTWDEAYDVIRSLVAEGGRLLFAVENELGLHRMTALRSRYTTNSDADWSVTSTFDRTRPRSVTALRERLGQAADPALYAAFPDWTMPTVLASCDPEPTGALQRLLEAATLGSPSFRQLGADPSRLTRAAVLSGRIGEFASGWYVLQGVPDPTQGPVVVESTASGKVATYTPAGPDAVQRVDESGAARTIELSRNARLVSEDLLDRAASGDLRSLRSAVTAYADAVRAMADGDLVPADRADVRPDNVMLDGDNYATIAPAAAAAPVDDALIDGLADLVGVIRARGARHPWPAAIDDATMLGNLVAMAGIDPGLAQGRTVSTAGEEPALPAYDIPGLLAVIERLTEANTALASKAAWFEQRLSIREREMRTRADQHRRQLADASRQQEILRSRAEDIRRSLTYRAGNVILGPVRELRAKTRGRF